MKKLIGTVFAIAFAVCHTMFSQPISSEHDDHLFAADGGSMVTVSTGIPYIGIAEYAYGISDRFSVGVMVGTTPNVEGYGVRARAIIAQPSDDVRFYFRVPAFYYPHTKDLGGDPWVLTWPVLSAEWRLNSGTRISAGAGAVVASCFDSFIRKIGLGSKESENEEMIMGGIWNTFHAGVAFPVSRDVMVQAEGSTVMHGFTFAQHDWVGGPPVILVIGLSYSFGG
ncbi:MAG TPA: hypothetical protein VMM58_08610 [Bacteroidota bacterium]|nr:hypothetical protein [Bacteroidota bacterium]